MISFSPTLVHGNKAKPIFTATYEAKLENLKTHFAPQ